MNEPFGRQPQPIIVTLEGEAIDVQYWLGHLIRAAEFKGDGTIYIPYNQFKIFPRAVND